MQNLEKTRNNFNLSVTALGAFWAWNILDLFLYRGNNFYWAMHIKIAPISYSSLYTHSVIDFDKKTDITFTVRF